MSTKEEPSSEEHAQWAIHNKEFANKLSCEDFENYQYWRVVAFFYSTIHYVEVYLIEEWEEEDDFKIQDHKKRKNLMMCTKLGNHFAKYKALEDACFNARYQCESFTEKEADDLKEDKYKPLISFIKENL